MHPFLKGYFFYTDEAKQIFDWLIHKVGKSFQQHWSVAPAPGWLLSVYWTRTLY